MHMNAHAFMETPQRTHSAAIATALLTAPMLNPEAFRNAITATLDALRQGLLIRPRLDTFNE